MLRWEILNLIDKKIILINLKFSIIIVAREQLVQRINDAFAAIRETEEDINNTIESIFVRCQSCIRNNGCHFWNVITLRIILLSLVGKHRASMRLREFCNIDGTFVRRVDETPVYYHFVSLLIPP